MHAHDIQYCYLFRYPAAHLSLYLSLFLYRSIDLCIYVFVHLCIYASIYLIIYLFIYLSIYLFIYLSIYLFIYLFIYLSIYYLSIYLFIYLLSIYLSIYLSVIYLSIYLSIYLFIYLLSIYLSIYLGPCYQSMSMCIPKSKRCLYLNLNLNQIYIGASVHPLRMSLWTWSRSLMKCMMRSVTECSRWMSPARAKMSWQVPVTVVWGLAGRRLRPCHLRRHTGRHWARPGVSTLDVWFDSSGAEHPGNPGNPGLGLLELRPELQLPVRDARLLQPFHLQSECPISVGVQTVQMLLALKPNHPRPQGRTWRSQEKVCQECWMFHWAQIARAHSQIERTHFQSLGFLTLMKMP